MADTRPRQDPENPAKRQKMTGAEPSSNPYLAHMYPEGEGGYENGSNGRNTHKLKASSNGHGQSGGLGHLKRHATTTQQAQAAENGPANPLNGNHLSERYFGILKTRRNLPVHAQRLVTRFVTTCLC